MKQNCCMHGLTFPIVLSRYYVGYYEQRLVQPYVPHIQKCSIIHDVIRTQGCIIKLHCHSLNNNSSFTLKQYTYATTCVAQIRSSESRWLATHHVFQDSLLYHACRATENNDQLLTGKIKPKC